MYNIGIQG